MARAALGWSIEQLADRTEVSSQKIKKVEAQAGSPAAIAANLKLIRTTLEEACIEFIGDATESPGVRLWNKPQP